MSYLHISELTQRMDVIWPLILLHYEAKVRGIAKIINRGECVWGCWAGGNKLLMYKCYMPDLIKINK